MQVDQYHKSLKTTSWIVVIIVGIFASIIVRQVLDEGPNFHEIIVSLLSIPIWIGISLGVYFLVKKIRKNKSINR
jgi:purine-cytosine permease-like protein